MVDIPRMRIPVFVSGPSRLNPDQEASAQIIKDWIDKYKLEWRALGRSDYGGKQPLREVLRIVRHCSGGLILGFEQYHVHAATYRRGCGVGVEKHITTPFPLPTPWNYIEAGILYNQKVPIMIFKEENIEGGIFDLGIADVMLLNMPKLAMTPQQLDDLDTVFQNWVAEVRTHYYND